MRPLLSVSMLMSLTACAQSAGLEELSALPADFPVELNGEIGHITRSPRAGQVSADIVFEEGNAARASYSELEARVAAQGWLPGEARIESKKWEVAAFDSQKGHVELGCCPARADRRHLILVTWWPPEAK